MGEAEDTMAPDPHHCVDCDRRLDGPPPTEDRRVRRCPDCQADLDTHVAALGDLHTAPPPRFRGVIALGMPLPGWPTDITLLALDVWDRFAELHLVEVPGTDPPAPHPRGRASLLGDQPPHKWVLTTDIGTVHHDGGGGGGTPGTDRLLAWHVTIAPSLPEDHAGLVDVRAQAPGAAAHTSIDLSTRPITRRSAVIDRQDTPIDGNPGCASCGPPPPPATPPDTERPPGLELDWAIPAPPEPSPDSCTVADQRPLCATCRSNRHTVFAAKTPTSPQPDRVIPLGAQLGPLFGTELVIPSLVLWPTWFDLTIVGHNTGAWAEGLRAIKRAGRWIAHDNHGRRYHGAATGGGSGLGLANKNLTFIPTLAPDATTLTVTFPPSFDGQQTQATIDIGPAPGIATKP